MSFNFVLLHITFFFHSTFYPLFSRWKKGDDKPSNVMLYGCSITTGKCMWRVCNVMKWWWLLNSEFFSLDFLLYYLWFFAILRERNGYWKMGISKYYIFITSKYNIFVIMVGIHYRLRRDNITSYIYTFLSSFLFI